MSVQKAAALSDASAMPIKRETEQTDYAWQNQTRGAIQLRPTDPTDFGVVPFKPDPYDEAIQFKRELMRTMPPGQPSQAAQLLGIPADQIQRTLPITDREIQWAQQKKAQQQQLQKDMVLASWYDMRNPAIRDWVNRHFDTYEKRQQAFVDSKFEIMKQYVRIAQTGPQNQDDLDFIYNVQTGIIQLPKGYHNFDALVTPLGFDQGGNPGETPAGTLIERGPLNLKRYTATQKAADITGLPENQVYPWGKFARDNAGFNPAQPPGAGRQYGRAADNFWTGFGGDAQNHGTPMFGNFGGANQNNPAAAPMPGAYFPSVWTTSTRR